MKRFLVTLSDKKVALVDADAMEVTGGTLTLRGTAQNTKEVVAVFVCGAWQSCVSLSASEVGSV